MNESFASPVAQTIVSVQEPDRHTRKCSICRHPHRDAIEEEFLHWHRVVWIAREYDIPDHRSIHRHARAVGLVTARRENLHSALDNIVEQSDGIRASASDVLKAMRAYTCLDANTGRWTDLPQPPRHLIYSNASRGTDNPVCAGSGEVAVGSPMPPPREAAAASAGFVGQGFRGVSVPDEFTGSSGEKTGRPKSSTSEAVFVSPHSAAGGPMPSRISTGEDAAASGESLGGRTFRSDIKTAPEDASTDSVLSAEPRLAEGDKMPSPTGTGNDADASSKSRDFRDGSVSDAPTGSPDEAAEQPESTASAETCEPVPAGEANTASKVLEPNPDEADETDDEPAPAPPFVMDRDFFDRIAGINRAPYGRR